MISGSLKGQRLIPPKKNDRHLRPMTDYVKESLFNKLKPQWADARVLDLFSGTGNLAIEAFSRGASYVEAVENRKTSLHLIHKNLTHLNLKGKIRVTFQDVFKYLRSYKREAFDIVLADPPFKDKIAHQVMLEVSKSLVLASDSLMVIEFSSREKMKDLYSGIQLLDKRRWSEKSISFFRKS